MEECYSIYDENFADCIMDMDPWNYFAESSVFDLGEYYREAETVQKKNIFERLLGMIIRCIQRIINMVASAISWLKNKIFPKKDPKSVDQILEKIGLSRSDAAKDPNRVDEWADLSDKLLGVKIEDVLSNPLRLSFEGDGEIVIHARDQFLNNLIPKRQGIVTNRHKGSMIDPRAFMTAMKFMKRPELMKAMEDAAEDLAAGKVDYNTQLRIQKTFANSITDMNFKKGGITLSDFQTFNQRLLKIQEKLQYIDDTRNSLGNTDKSSIDMINKFMLGVLNLQSGATTLCTALRHIYVIDPDYAETISDTKTLGIFVNEMLEMGLPSKYVQFNAWMVCKRDLKGNADVEDPNWGMSRVTFIPKDANVVYKIALNGWGVRSNQAEHKISDAVYAAGQGDHFAKVLELDDTGTVLTMEKVTIDKKKSIGRVDEVQAALNNAIHAAGFNGVIDDVRPGNIGFRGDVAVSYDYGWIKRSAQTT